MRLARLLAIVLLLGTLCGPLASPAQAITRPSRAAHLGYMVRREVRSLGRTLRDPPRATRLVLTSAVGYAAGLTALHFLGSPGTAAFVSYVSTVSADRVVDRYLPSTRAFGALAPPSMGRDALQTLAGASVAGLSAPMLIDTLHPIAEHMAALGDAAPGLIGLAARGLFAGPLVRGVGSMGASLLATGAHSALAHLMRLRNKLSPRRPPPAESRAESM